jgi:hypothetical protein
VLSALLKTIYWGGASGALICLGVYVGLAYSGKSVLLYRFSTHHSRLLSRKSKTFFAFAAFGFLVCIFQGADAMLGWMPSSWGSLDEDGGYTTLATTLAGMFAFVAGVALIEIIVGGTHDRFRVRQMTIEIEQLERLLDSSLDIHRLEVLTRDFQEETEKLRKREQNRTGRQSEDATTYWSPDGQLQVCYRHLTDLTERQKARLFERAEKAKT